MRVVCSALECVYWWDSREKEKLIEIGRTWAWAAYNMHALVYTGRTESMVVVYVCIYISWVRTAFIVFVSTMKKAAAATTTSIWLEKCFCVCSFFPWIQFFLYIWTWTSAVEEAGEKQQKQQHQLLFHSLVYRICVRVTRFRLSWFGNSSICFHYHNHISVLVQTFCFLSVFSLYLPEWMNERERFLRYAVVFRVVASIAVCTNDIACIARYVCCCCFRYYTLRTVCVFADTKIIVSFVHWFLSRDDYAYDNDRRHSNPYSMLMHWIHVCKCG